MSNYRMIEMTERHLPELLRIENASFTEPWGEDSFKAVCNGGENWIGRVCVDGDGKTVGYLCMICIAGEEGEIINVAVDPDFRRNGIGRFMMQTFVDEAKRREMFCMTLEVRASNIPAQTLYKSFGFKEIGRRGKYYSKPTEDAIIMMLELI